MKESFIAGIYNYCDHWCERCTFTTRCRNHESTSELSSEQLDVSNRIFWDTISPNIEKAIQLLHKSAKENGIDLDKVITEEESMRYQERSPFLHTATKDHLLSRLCKQYQTIVIPFIEDSENFVDKANELVDHLHLGMKSAEEVVQVITNIGDCLDIIQWYVYFMDTKLQRALRGKMEGEEWEIENGYQRDSDGSAKIAMIAIERSIGAWIRLHELMPATEDMALRALSLLTQVKNKSEGEFPQAMKFKRPGFDE
jgi:hypothetical protein